MIDENILKSLESNIRDPSYSIIVSEFKQPEFCNKDRLEVILKQYNPNLEEVIENKENIIEKLKETLTANNISIPSAANSEIFVNSCVEKTLTIDSVLDVDENDQMFISRLIGSISNEDDMALNSSRLSVILDKHGITIKQRDNPNYFNKTKFRIYDSNLIISIPKKVESISIISKKTNKSGVVEKSTTFRTITNNKMTLSFSKSFLTSDGYYDLDIDYTLRSDVTTQKIESITTPFEREIELLFNNRYTKVPGVIVTMDEDKKPFGSYTVEFLKTSSNKIKGCVITFKNVKRMKNYDDLNITILSPSG